MQLPLDLFEKITGYKTIRSAREGRERRLATRTPLAFRTAMLPYQQGALGEPVAVRVRELSPYGLSMLYRGSLRNGLRFAMRLPRREEEPVWIQCIVARGQSIGDGLHIIGATYDRVLGLLRKAREAAAAWDEGQRWAEDFERARPWPAGQCVVRCQPGGQAWAFDGQVW